MKHSLLVFALFSVSVFAADPSAALDQMRQLEQKLNQNSNFLDQTQISKISNLLAQATSAAEQVPAKIDHRARLACAKNLGAKLGSGGVSLLCRNQNAAITQCVLDLYAYTSFQPAYNFCKITTSDESKACMKKVTQMIGSELAGRVCVVVVPEIIQCVTESASVIGAAQAYDLCTNP